MNSASFFWSQWGQSLKFMQHHGTCMQPKAALCGHHAAVARILHAPGMIEVIDRVEEIKCLASDGSTDVHICLCHLEAYVRNLGPVNLFFTYLQLTYTGRTLCVTCHFQQWQEGSPQKQTRTACENLCQNPHIVTQWFHICYQRACSLLKVPGSWWMIKIWMAGMWFHTQSRYLLGY